MQRHRARTTEEKRYISLLIPTHQMQLSDCCCSAFAVAVETKMLDWTGTLRGFLCSMMLGAIGGLLFPIAATGQPGGSALRHLFLDAAPPAVHVTPDHAAVRSRFVHVDAGLLGGPGHAGPTPAGPILIELFDGLTYSAQRDRSLSGPKGSLIWRGHLEGVEDGRVTLVVLDHVVAGTIRLPHALYKLRYASGGRHVVEEIDFAALPIEAEPLRDGPPGESASEVGEEPIAAPDDDGLTIDVLVAYTPDARSQEGGTAAIEALSILAVDETNQAYANSAIGAQLRLVHTAEVSYVESGSISTDLSRLRSKTDGYMDEVHAWRETHLADVVALINANGGGYCGIAYVMTNLSNSFESNAFSVTLRTCATGNYSFGHEVGHNMGSTHDRDNGGSALYEYSYGYQDPGAVFRTVMAYNCPGGCPRRQHFSNPDVLFQGLPTGIDHDLDPNNAADNARSINNARYTIANWRVSGEAPTEPPTSPSNLVAMAASDTEIDLGWNDTSNNESGFELERSTDGASYAPLDSLGANVISYAAAGLDPSTTYHYRLRAVNSVGTSGWIFASATTDDPPEFVDDVATGEILGAGSVSGSYLQTWSQDGSLQIVTERESGGKKSQRHSYLRHDWQFDLYGGGSVTFFAKVWAPLSSDGDSFVFSYSTDGLNYVQMFTVSNTGDAGGYESFALPPSTVGPVSVRVADTDQASGNRSLDSVFVDHLYFHSDLVPGELPAAPSGLGATATSSSQIDLGWQDGSDDEYGFRIERSLDGTSYVPAGSVGADVTSFSDVGLAANTTHHYRVNAYNGAGASGYTSATATTLEGSAIELSANGYKIKGRHNVDLSWGGGTTPYAWIYRDGALIAVVSSSSGSYTDAIGTTGAATYVYSVCEEGGAVCSDPVSVIF
jgi:hypothetical protein